MTRFLIIGAGATGRATARTLIEGGHTVTMLTRHGGNDSPGITRVAGDAGDLETVTRLAQGAAAVINCANPKYHRWPTDWPPIARALQGACEATGATLVTLSNLYAYGEVTAPMTPDLPLSATYLKAQIRAQMWRDALAAYEAGRLTCVELRASDFIGAGAQSQFGDQLVPRILKGKTAYVLGSATTRHSWTYVGDVGRSLAAAATDDRWWGRAWHVVTNEAQSAAAVVNDLADAAGVAHVTTKPIPALMMTAVGLFRPQVREFRYTAYQFERDFIIDDQLTRDTFGMTPTPWTEICREVVAPFQQGTT